MITTMYTVYKHTNLNNGKAYVGWTSLSVDKRWKDHCYTAFYGSEYAFHRAIRKYGVSCWEHEILETHPSEQDAKSAEIRLIAEHKTFMHLYPNKGYNMTLGGEGVMGLRWTLEKRILHSGINSKLSKLTTDDILAMRRSFIGGMSQNELADMFYVSQPLVSCILNLKKYADIRLSDDEEAMLKHKLIHNKRTRKGVDNPHFGLKRSEAARHKMSIAKLGKPGNARGSKRSPEWCQAHSIEKKMISQNLMQIDHVN